MSGSLICSYLALGNEYFNGDRPFGQQDVTVFKAYVAHVGQHVA